MGEKFEGLDFRGVGDVGAATKIDELRAKGVFGEDVASALLDEFDLHGLIHAPVFGEAFGFGDELAVVC